MKQSSSEESWARKQLTDLLIRWGSLDQGRYEDLLGTIRVAISADAVEIAVDYFGETNWFEWDGSHEDLDSIVRELAGNMAATLDAERKEIGPTPWDAKGDTASH